MSCALFMIDNIRGFLRKQFGLIRCIVKDCCVRPGTSCTDLAVMSQIAEKYSFDDNAQIKLNEKIKNVLEGRLLSKKIWSLRPATCHKAAWRLPGNLVSFELNAHCPLWKT
jgi:hypothetical protein